MTVSLAGPSQDPRSGPTASRDVPLSKFGRVFCPASFDRFYNATRGTDVLEAEAPGFSSNSFYTERPVNLMSRLRRKYPAGGASSLISDDRPISVGTRLRSLGSPDVGLKSASLRLSNDGSDTASLDDLPEAIDGRDSESFYTRIDDRLPADDFRSVIGTDLTPASPSDPTPKRRKPLLTALEDIPAGAFSSETSVFSHFSSTSSSEVGLRIDKNGLVECNGSLIESAWLADDVQSVNTLVCLGTSAGTVTLRIIRPVCKGHKISYWFSQDILALLDIPFLKPINIRGDKCYECDRCGSIFERPNPLKIHLWNDCRSHTGANLIWKKLHVKSQSKITGDVAFNFTLTSSAFKPYQKVNPEEDVLVSATSRQELSAAAISSLNRSGTQSYGHQTYSRIENLVTNMGASTNRQGHLCIYCGKVYSRKYGLKIHIRTHTGFKPLKCKYCLRPFGDPSNLNKHVRLHVQAQTPYKCELCDKVLVRRRDLERHIRSRHQTELNL